MKKLICFSILFISLSAFSQPFELKLGDTVKFTGLPRRPNNPTGEVKIWRDSNGLFYYIESWKEGKDFYAWEGRFQINKKEAPLILFTQFSKNGTPEYIETTDSIRFVDEGVTTPLIIKSKNFHIPWGKTATLKTLYLQYALSNKNNEFLSDNKGIIRVRKVGNTTISNTKGSINLNLYVLSSDSTADMGHLWVDDKKQIIGIPYTHGLFDLITPDWKNKRDELLQAEVTAAQFNKDTYTCTSCDSGRRFCRNIGTRDTMTSYDRTFTLTDSGYTVKSDGRGSYYKYNDDLSIPVEVGCGLLIRPSRYFTVDLNHPVPGDIGVPLGVIKVNGLPGSFSPSGLNYFNEIMAQVGSTEDGAMQSFQDIPIGKTIQLTQLDFDCYINGQHYTMQMGPQPYGHCWTAKTKIYGDGTTQGTVTRKSNSEWVVDLPPGSIGRLFDNHNYDYNAVNKGLYYVSLHYEIKILK